MQLEPSSMVVVAGAAVTSMSAPPVSKRNLCQSLLSISLYAGAGTLTLISPRSSIRSIRVLVHPWQRLCDLLEKNLDIMTGLGGCFDKHDVEFLCFFFGFLRCHLSTVTNQLNVSMSSIE